jgi:tetratricopeptide (TPR) repeat protein
MKKGGTLFRGVSISAVAVFAALALCAPAPSQAQTAASAQDVQNCQTSQNASVITSACTRVAQDAKQPVATRTIAYYMLGNEQASQNNFDQAIQYFTQAIALEPAPQVLSARALAYLGRAQANNTPADIDSAIKDLTQAITASAKQPDPTNYFYRGLAYVGKNDGADAIKDFNEAISLDPKGTLGGVVYYELGDAYFLTKDYAATAVRRRRPSSSLPRVRFRLCRQKPTGFRTTTPASRKARSRPPPRAAATTTRLC